MNVSSARLLTTSVRVYAALLYLYPLAFQQAYSHEMTLTFHDYCRDELEQKGPWGIIALWVFVVTDLARSAGIEHLKAVITLFRVFIGIEKEYRMSTLLHFDTAIQTDKGKTRPTNEDNVVSVVPTEPQVMTEKGALFVVADGMGGHNYGEVASEMAVNIVREAYYQGVSTDIADALSHALQQANDAIYQYGIERSEKEQQQVRLGTTCVAAVLQGSRVYVANAGDSLAYLIRNGLVRQIAEDHSWVAEQVRTGAMTEEEARQQGKNNVIVRCLGNESPVEIYVTSEEVQNDDILVLCTDGLHNLITPDELRAIVEQHEAQESVARLIERANEQGSPDNITAAVIHVYTHN